MNRKTLIVLLLFCHTLVVSQAQFLALDSIKALIEKQHPDLSMYDMQVKAYDAYAAGAKSWESPQIGTGLYMIPYTFEKNMGSYMVSVQQMIPNPAKLKANEQYMNGMSSVEIQNKSVVKKELFAKAKLNYTKLLILKKKKTILSESEELLNYIIQVSEIRYPYEQEKLNNIYKAKASLGELQNMELINNNEINQKMISLNTLMNRDKNIVFEIDTNYVIRNYENETIDTTAIINFSSDVKSIDQEIKVSQLKQQIELSKRKPDFGIRYDNMTTFGMQPNQFSIMGMITIPIVPWSSKMYKANAEGLKFVIASYEKQKESLLNEVSGMIQSVQTEIKSKKLQVDLYQNNIIPALQKNYKTTMLAYEQNTEDLFMVLDAWQSLKMGQTEYLDQLEELLLLQVEYEKFLEKN